jgi:hypothetical protein
LIAQLYFQGIVNLARIIRWDVESTGVFDRTMTAVALIVIRSILQVPLNRPRSSEEILRRIASGCRSKCHARRNSSGQWLQERATLITARLLPLDDFRLNFW